MLKCTSTVEPVVKGREKYFTMTYFLRRPFFGAYPDGRGV